jgi:hypothetical protein
MQPLSAINAIAPAWNHTRRLLLTPRNWRLLLKIGAVAFFANMGGCNLTGPIPGQGHTPSLPSAAIAPVLAMVFLVSGVALLLALAFFYLSSRLQFVLFEVVLRRDTTIAPIWRRYGRATWHWMGLQLAFFATAFLCLTPFVIPIVLHFVHSANSGTIVDQQNMGSFVLAVFGFILIALLIVILMAAGYTLLHDFGLPFMALEGTPLTATVRRVVSLIRAEPGQVLLYLLMRVVLAFAGAIVFEFALVFGVLIAVIPLGGMGGILWVAFHHAGTAGHILMIAGWVLLGIIFLVLLVAACMMMFGYLYAFLQAYTLYFLGGRYSLVGSYLEPLLPQPVPAYPGVPQGYYPPAPPAETQQPASTEAEFRKPDPNV